jgi:hypothetical protein
MSPKLTLSYPAILELFGAHAVTQRTESRQFLAWFLANYYRLDETELDECICDGSYDKGVDGVYASDQLGQIDVFQARMAKSSKKSLGDSGLHEFKGALAQFATADAINNMAATTKNVELKGLLEEQEIAKKVKEGYKVRGIFLTNAKRDQNAIDFLKETPEIVLYDESELQKHYVPIDKTEPIASEISFDLSGIPFMEYPIGQVKMVVAPLAAGDLVKMEGILNGELFAWNVRQWLRKTKVNKDIEASIRNQDEHKFFPAFHNGLTVLCKVLNVKNDKITVSGYAVVNGCQSLTGFNENKKLLSSDLRILTKIIQVAPETPLAIKITDHTNNQNGTTARDLQSNNPIQTRLQTEISSGGSDFNYRIKRGEHPEWPAERTIENELAARILLAFDLKEPWSCHQSYRLFDELHSDIFGRPEVNGLRIINAYTIYQDVMSRLDLLDDQLFARYSLTRFLILYLLREALETDPIGKQYCLDPIPFAGSVKACAQVKHCVGNVAQVIFRLLNGEVKRRNAKTPLFDFKRELKSPNSIRDIRSTIVSQYEVMIDGKLAHSFSDEWNKGQRQKGKSRKQK